MQRTTKDGCVSTYNTKLPSLVDDERPRYLGVVSLLEIPWMLEARLMKDEWRNVGDKEK